MRQGKIFAIKISQIYIVDVVTIKIYSCNKEL